METKELIKMVRSYQNLINEMERAEVQSKKVEKEVQTLLSQKERLQNAIILVEEFIKAGFDISKDIKGNPKFKSLQFSMISPEEDKKRIGFEPSFNGIELWYEDAEGSFVDKIIVYKESIQYCAPNYPSGYKYFDIELNSFDEYWFCIKDNIITEFLEMFDYFEKYLCEYVEKEVKSQFKRVDEN